MQIDPQIVRDLFAAGRKMQMELHAINAQCFALRTQAAKLKDEGVDRMFKYIENIEADTEYIYKGCEGFPSVAQTLEACSSVLQASGEWKEFSDYTGFDYKEREGQHNG